MNRCSARVCNISQNRLNKFYYFFFIYGLSILQKYFSYEYVTTCFENFLVLQGSLMSYSIIFKYGIDLLMFQNHFFIGIFLFILVTQGKKIYEFHFYFC
jgi:hypothetical protein